MSLSGSAPLLVTGGEKRERFPKKTFTSHPVFVIVFVFVTVFISIIVFISIFVFIFIFVREGKFSQRDPDASS